MAKNKNKRKQSQQDRAPKKVKVDDTPSFPSENPSTTRNKVKVSQTPLPPPFPHENNLPIPQDDFLRCVDPYKQSFEKAIETSYEGFAVDTEQGAKNDESAIFDHEDIQKALIKMDGCGLFRTDVTQPFGLGTICAKTYVTRCLLGDEGTTYKYLGLRMFAHPWTAGTDSNNSMPKDASVGLEDALGVISKLNNRLTERTQTHLNDLDEKRRARQGFSGQACVNGRAKFDITLINRMTNTPELKLEPTMGQDKCSVSWHAGKSKKRLRLASSY